jgi:carbonic anhydrase
MRQYLAAVLAATACSAALAIEAHPGHGSVWSYSGDFGPDKWSTLLPEFGACTGKNQSPVDIAHTLDAPLPALTIAYKAAGTEVVNNGHTVQVNYGPGSTLKIDGIAFELKQFHFHSPSENRLAGKSFPLEGHLVHADKDGNLAVVAVFFEQGAANATLAKVWGGMPKKDGDKSALPAGISATGLLPAKRDYFRYSGSLTTPPCSEGVRWFVMKQPMTVSKEQLTAFQSTLGFANNRPVQRVNARQLLR